MLYPIAVIGAAPPMVARAVRRHIPERVKSGRHVRITYIWRSLWDYSAFGLARGRRRQGLRRSNRPDGRFVEPARRAGVLIP